jgi:hypothetical protein
VADCCGTDTDTNRLAETACFSPLAAAQNSLFNAEFSGIVPLVAARNTATQDDKMKLTVVNTENNEADREWGFEFGVDGIVNLETAAKMLADASTRTVLRRIADGKIRGGNEGRRLVICLRSIRQHIRRGEK